MGYATILLIIGLLIGILSFHLFRQGTMNGLFLVGLFTTALAIACFYIALRMYSSGVKAGYRTELFGQPPKSK